MKLFPNYYSTTKNLALGVTTGSNRMHRPPSLSLCTFQLTECKPVGLALVSTMQALENQWPALYSLEIREHKARNRKKKYGFVTVKKRGTKIQSQSNSMNWESFLAA